MSPPEMSEFDHPSRMAERQPTISQRKDSVAIISTADHAFKSRALPPAAPACMGIVFGDIGTSPLYTLQVAVKAASPSGVISPAAVIGIVSLIFWSLHKPFALAQCKRLRRLLHSRGRFITDAGEHGEKVPVSHGRAQEGPS